MSSFILGTWFNMRGQNFYEESERQSDTTTDGDESTIMFLITIPQYVFMGIAFHTATQFRNPIYTNLPFMCLLCLQLIIISWITLGPLGFMLDSLELTHIDFYFKVIILGSGIVNGIITIIFEQIVQRTIGKMEMEKSIEFKFDKKDKKESRINNYLVNIPPYQKKID